MKSNHLRILTLMLFLSLLPISNFSSAKDINSGHSSNPASSQEKIKTYLEVETSVIKNSKGYRIQINYILWDENGLDISALMADYFLTSRCGCPGPSYNDSNFPLGNGTWNRLVYVIPFEDLRRPIDLELQFKGLGKYLPSNSIHVLGPPTKSQSDTKERIIKPDGARSDNSSNKVKLPFRNELMKGPVDEKVDHNNYPRTLDIKIDYPTASMTVAMVLMLTFIKDRKPRP